MHDGYFVAYLGLLLFAVFLLIRNFVVWSVRLSQIDLIFSKHPCARGPMLERLRRASWDVQIFQVTKWTRRQFYGD